MLYRLPNKCKLDLKLYNLNIVLHFLGQGQLIY